MSEEWENAVPAQVAGDRKSNHGRGGTRPCQARLPPHSIEAEQGVLGCILWDPMECLPACIEQFKSGSLVFYDLRHREIYGVMLELYDAGSLIDVTMVAQRLKDRNQLEGVGGLVYLASLPDATPSAANVRHYMAIVREKFVLRRMIATCTELVARAYEHSGPVDQLLDEVENDLTELTATETQGTERHIKQVLGKVVDQLEVHYARGKQQLNGLPTGPTGNYLDKLMMGIASTDYGVLAGRPGSGKTSKALNIVEYLAKDYVWWEPTGEFHPLEPGEDKPRPVMRSHTGIPVCIFSIEMTGESLGMRMVFSRAGVDMAQYMQGFGHVNDQMKLTKAVAQLAQANIYIDDASSQTIGQIAAKARRMVRQFGIKLFVLDYIQLVEHDGASGFDRQKEITKISRKIMALKKELQVPWIVLAQMNRDIEKAERTRKPVMSDLKDCGALEQDADWLMFSYKTPLNEVEKEPEGGGMSDAQIIETIAAREKWEWSRTPYRVDFIVVKHRDGATGEAQEVFLKNLCRFEDWHQWKVKHGAEGLKKGESRAEEGEL